MLAALLTAAIAAPASGPDLRIADIGIQERAASPGELRVRSTLRNAGRRRARRSHTRFSLSRDRTPGADVRLGTAVAAALRAGRSRTRVLDLPVPAGLEAGGLYVIACADAGGVVRERRERNNCRASALPVDVVPQLEPRIPPGPG